MMGEMLVLQPCAVHHVSVPTPETGSGVGLTASGDSEHLHFGSLWQIPVQIFEKVFLEPQHEHRAVIGQ